MSTDMTLRPSSKLFTLRHFDQQVQTALALGPDAQTAFIAGLKYAFVAYITCALVKDVKQIMRTEMPAPNDTKSRDAIRLARVAAIDDFYRMFPAERSAAEDNSRSVILDVPAKVSRVS